MSDRSPWCSASLITSCMTGNPDILLVFREMLDSTALRLVSLKVGRGRPLFSPHISRKTSEIWATLVRSTVGRVANFETRARLLTEQSVETIGKEDPRIFGTGGRDVRAAGNNLENLRGGAAVGLRVVW
jgi:hypothetical protein